MSVRLRLLGLAIAWLSAGCGGDAPPSGGLGSTGHGPNVYPETCLER